MGLTTTIKTPSGKTLTYGTDPISDEEFRAALRDERGRYRTKSLFLEKNTEGKYPSYFNMGYEDTEDTISFRKRYLDLADVTEYKPAMQLLGSWEHWKALTSSPMFKDFIEELREELKTKLESTYLSNLQSETRGPRALEANKFLLSYMKEPKSGSKRGRPSKSEKDVYLKKLVEDEAIINNDLERITTDG